MNRKFFCCAALAVVSTASLWAADPITWKFPGAVMEWNKPYNAKLEETDDAVKVIPVKADHAIINPKTDIDPSLYNSLRITYRANGFKQPTTTGALYFTTDKQKSYHHKFQINLPTLEVDGKRHNISVRLDSESWTSAAKITSLRLDITDQMPGDVYIEKIEFFARDAKFGTAVWDFANGEGTWDSSLKMDVTAENKELKLDITGKDSHLFNLFDRFDGSKYTKLKITYRASGFTPARTTGGLFYLAKGGNKKFNPKDFVKFPSLICDGKEHSFTVNVKFPAAEIYALRLDIVDQAPGTVWLKKIEFLP